MDEETGVVNEGYTASSHTGLLAGIGLVLLTWVLLLWLRRKKPEWFSGIWDYLRQGPTIRKLERELEESKLDLRRSQEALKICRAQLLSVSDTMQAHQDEVDGIASLHRKILSLQETCDTMRVQNDQLCAYAAYLEGRLAPLENDFLFTVGRAVELQERVEWLQRQRTNR
jgi:hypothetical protein